MAPTLEKNNGAKLNKYYSKQKEQFVIWATDNNGQVSRKPGRDGEIIGKWTTASETDTGNVGNPPPKRCRNNNIFVANTFFWPKKEEA